MENLRSQRCTRDGAGWRGLAPAVSLWPIMKTATLPTPKELEALPLLDQPDMRQFVLQVGGQRARVEYDRQGDRIFLTGTDLPKSLEESGVGDVLMHKVLVHVEEQRWKLVPTAAFAKAYLRRHTEWKRLLVKGIHL